MDCPKCGFKVQDGMSSCLQCGASLKEFQFKTEYKAGFWRRGGAMAIDLAILLIPIWLVMKYIGGFKGFVVSYLLMVLYYSVFELLPVQASVGKRVFGLFVTDMNGNRLAAKSVIIRNLFKIISLFTIVGYPLAAFTENKQAMHDLAAKAFVLRKPE